jgi:hypothetical protein
MWIQQHCFAAGALALLALAAPAPTLAARSIRTAGPGSSFAADEPLLSRFPLTPSIPEATTGAANARGSSVGPDLSGLTPTFVVIAIVLAVVGADALTRHGADQAALAQVDQSGRDEVRQGAQAAHAPRLHEAESSRHQGRRSDRRWAADAGRRSAQRDA